jgi:hypothetical protein
LEDVILSDVPTRDVLGDDFEGKADQRGLTAINVHRPIKRPTHDDTSIQGNKR